MGIHPTYLFRELNCSMNFPECLLRFFEGILCPTGGTSLGGGELELQSTICAHPRGGGFNVQSTILGVIHGLIHYLGQGIVRRQVVNCT